MSLPRTLRVAVAAAVAGAALAVGAVALTAGATGTNATYFACLKGGTLSNVGTKVPTCASPATEISWNQTGPAGATILSGTGAPGIGVGLAGDYYIETSNHKIFGPAARVCTQLPCRTLWGAGTSLVGPAGQGYSYDTSTAGTVNDPSGQDENVLIQTLPVGGDFQIDARVVGHNSAGNSTRWQCSLFAANPGDPTGVLLDTTAATNSGEISNNGNETDMSLQGVVSIAAGATVSIYCEESAAHENDNFEYPHITSTQVSGFSTVAPG